jgi:hypothetical protein
MSSRENLLDAIQKYLEGGVAKHKANVEVYLNQSVGIGEHSDIIDTIEKELDSLSEYDDKLYVLDKYFSKTSTKTKELLNEGT